MRIVLHADLDAYFCSVEERERPELRGHPVIVGSPPNRRGVVAACNYAARKFGVRSAMPSATAAKLCPKAVFIDPRIDLYRAESARIMSILELPGSIMEKMSIDEAYLDVSALVPELEGETLEQRFGRAERLAADLKRRIREERGLTASIGVASNKLLAKIGSDFRKPDGLTVVPEDTKAIFLRPLPVRALHGIGPVTERALAAAGIRKIADLQDYTGDLAPLVGSFAERLRQFSVGEDDRPVDPSSERKSISSEETFQIDTMDRRHLRDCLKQQSEEISEELRKRGLFAQTVQVKVRYGNFETLTRQITAQEWLQEGPAIYRLACYLMAKHKLVKRPIRLLGSGVAGLSPHPPRQLRFL